MFPVLVADEDSVAVETVVRAVGRVGLTVVRARNGVEAIERLRADRPAIILLDRLLPIVDGPHLCQRIRDTPAGSAAAVFLSGLFTPAEGEALRQRYGFSDVVAKPLSVDGVLSTILPFLPRTDSPAGQGRRPGPEPPWLDVATRPVVLQLLDSVVHRRTGELLWTDGSLAKGLFLEHGALVGAHSNGIGDSWPGWLGRDPQLSPEQRARLPTYAVPGPGPEGWAAHLEKTGELQAQAVRASRRRWAVSLALDILARTRGRAAWIEGSFTTEAVAPVALSTLLFRALRHSPGASFEPLMPARTCLLRRAGQEASGEALELTALEQELLALADGGHTLGELLALGRLVQRDVRPFLLGLLAQGVLELVPRAERHPPARSNGATALAPGVPASGNLAEVHLSQALGASAAAGLTGILQVRSGEAQSSIHVREGRVVFARSNEPQYRLGNILLRTGRISPEDHTQALALQAREPTRRLGALLFEARALSLKELHSGLADQVVTIVQHGLRWIEGGYAFLEGELPSDDMVSLEVSTPSLILQTLPQAVGGAAGAYLPAADRFLLRTSRSERVVLDLVLTPAAEAVLRAADAGSRVAEVPGQAGLDAEEAAPVLLALLAAGVLESSAVAPEPSSPAVVPSERLPGPGEVERLGLRIGELQGRVLALEAENRRLRGFLSSRETVYVG